MKTRIKFNSRDSKDIEKYFKELFKISVLNNLLIIDNEGKITRNYKKDLERSINLIKYGFDEGIKYMKPKEERLNETVEVEAKNGK